MHWFRASFPMVMYDPVMAWLLGLWGASDGHVWGFWRYDANQSWTNGVTLYYDQDADRAQTMHNGRFAIEVPGSSIEAMEPGKFLEFLRVGVRDFGFRATRLDVFFDDHARTITPMELIGSVREILPNGILSKHDWCGPEKCDPRIESDLFQVTSAAVNFGTRGNNGGESYLRCYDKKLESGGENNAVRWERELADHKAQLAVDALLEAFDDGLEAVARTIGGLITGAIDFRYRSEKPDEPNLSRLRRYPFWQKIIDTLAGPLRLAGRVIRKAVQKAKRYVEDQVTGTVQMISLAMTPLLFREWWDGVMNQPGRLKPAHLKAAREYQLAVLDGLIDPRGG